MISTGEASRPEKLFLIWLFATTTLFEALNLLDGTIIGRNMQRHRHQEFIRFLNRIEREVPADKAIHVILDNYAAHKHPKVREWLQRHPRFTFHFTPTSCSWLNAVEGFFARLTNRRLKRGVGRGRLADLHPGLAVLHAERRRGRLDSLAIGPGLEAENGICGQVSGHCDHV